MRNPVVIHWDADELPTELRAVLPAGLRDLPPGRYVVEQLDDGADLTPEEDAGLLLAIREIEDGQGVDWEQLRDELRNRLAE